MGWTDQELNCGGGEIFHTHSDLPWCPPTLLYNRYWVSFLMVTQLGCGVDHLPLFRLR